MEKEYPNAMRMITKCVRPFARGPELQVKVKQDVKTNISDGSFPIFRYSACEY